MNYCLIELSAPEFRNEAALRSYELAQARGEIAEYRGMLELYAAGLAILYMRLALAEREGA
jgi:hypothetical protein